MQKKEDDVIEVSKDVDKYKFIKQSSYGARCFPTKCEFKSSFYDKIISGEMKYEELKQHPNQYVIFSDVSSLYPASMCYSGFDENKNFIEAEYGSGMSRWSEDGLKEFTDGKIGFYSIEYTCTNKKLRVAILPRYSKSTECLVWSLEDGDGIYSSIDIKIAIENGYENTFGKCLVYDSTSNHFKNYVSIFSKLKQEAEIEENPVQRGVCKLSMNALYGKCLQRAIITKTTIVQNLGDKLAFMEIRTLTDCAIIDNKNLILTGTIKNISEQCKAQTKPVQLGSLILSYSRKIMLEYTKFLSPKLDTMPFNYTDTDSLHILGTECNRLIEAGYYIENKKNAKLGYLTNDLKNNGLVFHEVAVSPK